MKVLIAIESCFQDRFKHQAQRDTWMKDLGCHPAWPGVTDKRFFLGDVVDKLADDEINLLNVNDSYESLAVKTRVICQYAVENNYDYLFKCDTDTLIRPWGLIVLSGFQNHDYLGGFNEDRMPADLRDRFGDGTIQFASGGAGYWLSKKALTIIANSDKVISCAEDVFVAAALKEHGILPVWNPGYRWRPGATVDKDLITLHLSSALQKKYEPWMMHERYEQLKREFL